jgi:phosphoglycerate dehydrogenase-like enzyme
MLYESPGPYREVLEGAGFEVVYVPGNRPLATPGALRAFLVEQRIEAVLASMEPFTREVLSGAALKVIARMGVGYDAIDVAAATACGVAVTITPGTNDVSVAEMTIALLLGVFRGFPACDLEVRGGRWRRSALPRLEGRTLGLVGLGRIGKAVVPRAQGLGLKVIAYDPFPDTQFADGHDVRLVGFDKLLVAADIVSLHLPCTAENVDLIDRAALAKMKPGAVLINTARGGLVDEDALADALAEGRLFGAGLDVFKTEPLPADSRLLKSDHVLMSPHMGGLDEESQIAMSTLAARCVADLYQGRWPDGCVVNEALRAHWKWRED